MSEEAALKPVPNKWLLINSKQISKSLAADIPASLGIDDKKPSLLSYLENANNAAIA